MNMAAHAVDANTLPKSYLPETHRLDLMREGDDELVYEAEAREANKVGDMKTAWAWLALTTLPAHSLMRLKRNRGAQFIRDMGFKTLRADAVYGADWLDREERD